LIDNQSLKNFQNNLKKIKDFTHEELVMAMEVSQAVIVNDAKSDHPKYEKGIIGHPSKRYYTRTSKLTNTIRPGEVKATTEEIIGEIKAGDSSLTNYAAFVESRYPFLEIAIGRKYLEVFQIFAQAVKRVIS
jgi:hypothetical protein